MFLWLTDEPFDAQRLDLHVDQQSAVCLHQRRGQGQAGFGVGQLYYPCGDAVDQAGGRQRGTKRHLHACVALCTIHHKGVILCWKTGRTQIKDILSIKHLISYILVNSYSPINGGNVVFM